MENFDPISEGDPIKTKSNKFTLVTVIVLIVIAFMGYMYITNNTTFTTEDYPIIDSEIEEESVTSNTLVLEVNKVSTYDGDVVTFNIPKGFEAYSADDENYKLFDKEVGDDEIDVDVSADYSTLTEYIDDVNDEFDYLKENYDYYKNVSISETEEIIVNGNKFYKIVISYDIEHWNSELERIEEAYVAHEINDEYLYVVEIDNLKLMSEGELKQFLTIQK